MPRSRDPLVTLRRLAVPIAVYLVVTVLLPAANGAWSDAQFLVHTAWVLAGCLAAAAIAAAAGLAARRLPALRSPRPRRPRGRNLCPGEQP